MIRFKHFHDNLNIVLILAPGRRFFRARYVQFPLKLMEKKYMKNIFPRELL